MRTGRFHGKQGFTLIELMIVIAIITILAGILLPNMVRSRDQAKFSACEFNLRALASAIESYSTDSGGRYPTALTQLTPEFINSIPTCPMAGTRDVYINGFASNDNPDIYTIVCSTANHLSVDAPANYPQYSAIQGLIPR